MKVKSSYIPFQETGYFSKIVTDYLNNEKQLQPFYTYQPNLESVKKAIEVRKNFKTNRVVLVNELRKQYEGISLNEKQEFNLNSLLKENTFTVTTAHQPNIFTGPLYFIYKILHVIKIADEWNTVFKDCHFVPIFFMGSEDADLEELGYINIEGVKYVWDTSQTGAVGRMKVDKKLLVLIDKMSGQIGVYKFGNEFIQLIKKCFTEGKTIQQATLEFINILFQHFGLLILIPDNKNLKEEFKVIIFKELEHNFSNKEVQNTVNQLNNNYKIQTSGRAINLFYLTDNARNRIVNEYGTFGLKTENNAFQQIDIQHEIENNIQAFSPNVVLRPVFQELILPNIAFIGGGGELAYWLELKNVFQQAEVPYPILLLRNSFLLIENQHAKLLEKYLISKKELFLQLDKLLAEMMKREIDDKFSAEIQKAIHEIKINYQAIKNNIQPHYPTLSEHTNALETKTLKSLQALEKKIIRAEKKKNAALINQITKLKESLFPKNSLQERVENIASFYAKYGSVIFNEIYNHSLTIEQQFAILSIEND